MKLRKGLFMLCAGLSLCACSSDDGNQFPEGTGRVEVRIVPPTTARAITNGTSGNNGSSIKLTGDYEVTLTAAAIIVNSQTTTEHTITIANGEQNKIATFTNVKNPSKVVVKLRNGAASYNTAITTELGNAEAAEVPAYGETTTFTPDLANNKYTASVKMAIPVARLEIGNITFTTTDTKFENLTVAGVYLDNLRTNGGSYAVVGDEARFASAEATTNYYFRTGTDPNYVDYGKGNDESPYILGNVEESGNFVGNAPIAKLPTSEGEVFAYNFYGATPDTPYPTGLDAVYNFNPKFKICFSEAQLNTEASSIPRYAMITTYKIGGTPIVLENGKIYRVTAAALTDANIVDDEDGAVVDYQVEVTVEEASWTITDVDGIWQ